MAKEKSEGALATLPSSPLTSMAALADDEEIDVPVAFMGFHSSKSKRAGEIESALPSINEGSPYVCIDGNRYELVQGIQILAGQKKFFTSEDDNGKILDASLDKTDDCWKENVLCVILVYTADKVIPTCTTLKTTKVRAARDFVSAAALTNKDEWVEAQGPIGQRLAELPPRLRVIGYLNMQQRTAKSGRLYHLARCNAKTPNDSQVELLINAMGDEGFNDDLKRASEAADGRWKWLDSEFLSNNNQQ